MDKRWTLIAVTLILIILIYSFLSLVLKKDKKKNVGSRVYRDYSNYNKKNYSEDNYNYRSTYSSSAEANKIINNLSSSFTAAPMINSYNNFMNAAFKGKTNANSSSLKKNLRYQEMMKLSNVPLPELQIALAEFRDREYEDAISHLNEALDKLDPMEMKNKIEIYSLLAECYLKLKNDDGYIQNKIRQVRMERKFNKALRNIFPKYPPYEFATTQEASTNLLRIRSSVSKLPDTPMVREMVKKAELDLEVARKVTQ